MLNQEQYNDLTALLDKHFHAAPVAQGPLFTERRGKCRLRERLYVPIGCVSAEDCDAFTYKIPIPYEIEVEVPKLDANGVQEYDAFGIEQTEIVKQRRTETHTVTTYDYFNDPELGQCIGFLARDIQKLIKHFGHLQIVDERVRVPLDIPYQFTGKLFKRQEDAITSFSDPNISGILKCPPGWGKTVFMMAYIALQRMRTLVLIHDTTLINQFMESARNPDFTNIAALEQEDGQLMGKLSYDRATDTIHDYPITFMTYHLVVHNPRIQELIRNRYGLVLIDECHHAAASSMDGILRNLNAFLTVGVTATVHRKDGFDAIFEDLIGPVRYVGEVDANCHVTFKKGGSVSTMMSNMQNIKKRLGAQESRNRLICADIHTMATRGSKCGIILEHIDHGFALEKLFAEQYPSLNIGFYSATRHRPSTLADCKARMDAPRAIKKLVAKESSCLSRATALQFAQYDQSLDPHEIAEILRQIGCPDMLLDQCFAMARGALDVFISTRKIFAEGLDMPMLSHMSVVVPMAAPRKRKKKDGEEDTEGGVVQQIVGRTQRHVYLSDGTVNWNKPPSTLFYYVDDGPDILEGCRRSFENACKRVGYKLTYELDDRRKAFRKMMNAKV